MSSASRRYRFRYSIHLVGASGPPPQEWQSNAGQGQSNCCICPPAQTDPCDSQYHRFSTCGCEADRPVFEMMIARRRAVRRQSPDLRFALFRRSSCDMLNRRNRRNRNQGIHIPRSPGTVTQRRGGYPAIRLRGLGQRHFRPPRGLAGSSAA